MSYILYDPEAPVIQRKRPKRDCTKIVLTDDQQQWLRQHYPTTLNKECAAHLGISASSVHRWARRLGLKKDPDWFHQVVLERCAMMAEANRGEGNQGIRNLVNGAPHRFRKGENNRMRNGEENEARRIARFAESRRELIRKERMRVRWGLPQETKIRVIQNRQATNVRHSMKRAGYIVPGRCAWIVYYNDTTHRIASLERSAQQAGITISPHC